MSTKWKYRLKEWFSFSKKERLGFVVLLVVVLLVIVYPLIDFKSNNSEQPSFAEFVEQVDSGE